jgi:hypothetical protein
MQSNIDAHLTVYQVGYQIRPTSSSSDLKQRLNKQYLTGLHNAGTVSNEAKDWE